MKENEILYSRLIDQTLACGAANATVISAEQVITSSEFRRICERNGCGKYDRCWVCPPHIGPIDELIPRVYQYSFALVYQTIATIEDSFDIEGMLKAGSDHAKVSQRLQATCRDVLRDDFLHLTCGGCHLCEQCAKLAHEPCRYPDHALPSLEGYGVDVYQTVRNTSLRYINGTNTVTYFGMILFEE